LLLRIGVEDDGAVVAVATIRIRTLPKVGIAYLRSPPKPASQPLLQLEHQ